MRFRNPAGDISVAACFFTATALTALALFGWTETIEAGTLAVPNGSFESPQAPRVDPYASPDMDDWQKPAQPIWYDPNQFQGSPWAYLVGQFFNVPFPDKFKDNCEGDQAAFLFAVPEVAVFQDYSSVGGTNTVPTHAFDAKFKTGASYDLTVGVTGGGGGMRPGVTLELSLYYRDVSSNKVKVASISITNSPDLFPTNTHFVDFPVHVPAVKATDPWAEQHIGIQLLSTTSFELMGGYWDVDNVRLTETPAQSLTLTGMGITNGHFSFMVLSEPGHSFEVQATTNLTAIPSNWSQIGVFTNVTPATLVTDDGTNFAQRYYRARQL